LGFSVNVALWLSATWHVHPYFLGSDSIYAIAWLALLVGILEGRRVRDRLATAPPLTRSGLARRDVLRGGAVAAASVVIGALAHVFAGSAPSAAAGSRAAGSTAPARPRHSAGTSATHAPNRPATSPTASPQPKVSGKPIAS